MSKVSINDELQNNTVRQLRSRLKKKKLGLKGTKQELVERLLASEKNMKKKTKSRQKKPEIEISTNGSVSENRDIREREMDKKERDQIVLWKSPVTTLRYFVLESGVLFYLLYLRLQLWKKTVATVVSLMLCFVIIYNVEGDHQQTVAKMEKTFLWCAYWVGLGVLSSVGLGTGLHTFLLYLGPHIAAVTLAAYECLSTDFPEPPYPTDITCPERVTSHYISMWAIISKVRLESFMWGAGTALGELPPYFMARAARLSGADLDDDDLEEIQELIHDKQANFSELSFLERAKLSIHSLVQKVGFFGILLCASIPNPLFDLAGITCGHFLIPFWTFFGATLIGKAIIKMHIQKLFVIFLFSEHHVETVVNLLGKLPKFGKLLQEPFKDYLTKQKHKLHHKPGSSLPKESTNILSWVFEKVVIVMVAYFLLSIINSMAQSYHKRQCKTRRLLSR